MSSCSLIKDITPKIRTLCFVLINSVILNLLCFWILSQTTSSSSYIILYLKGKPSRKWKTPLVWGTRSVTTLHRKRTTRHPVNSLLQTRSVHSLQPIKWLSLGNEDHPSIFSSCVCELSANILQNACMRVSLVFAFFDVTQMWAGLAKW